MYYNYVKLKSMKEEEAKKNSSKARRDGLSEVSVQNFSSSDDPMCEGSIFRLTLLL